MFQVYNFDSNLLNLSLALKLSSLNPHFYNWAKPFYFKALSLLQKIRALPLQITDN